MNLQVPSMLLLPIKPVAPGELGLKDWIGLDWIGPGWTVQGDSAQSNSYLVSTSAESACPASVFKIEEASLLQTPLCEFL